MKEIEITCKVKVSFEECIKQINKLNFNQIEEFYLYDSYFCHFNKQEIKNQTEEDILKNSLLVRKIVTDTETIEEIVYKNKEYDSFHNVVSEEKIKTKVENVEKLKNILTKAGLIKVVDYEQQNIIFQKNDVNIILQKVSNLGVFIELEQLEKHNNLPANIVKQDLINIIKSFNLPIENNFDIKKAQLAIINFKNTL